MYQNCCKKCGSISLHTEVKGNNKGLYCDDCGAFQKWLGKDELRAFEYANKSRGLRATAKLYDEAFLDYRISERLNRLIDVTDDAIAAVYEWFMGNMEDSKGKKEEYQITYPSTEFELVMRRKKTESI